MIFIRLASSNEDELLSFTFHPCNNTVDLHKEIFYGCTDLPELFNNPFEYDVNFKDHHGNTYLHLAIMTGNTKLVKRLLEHPDIVVDTANELGWNALSEAISYGSRSMLKDVWRRYKAEKVQHVERHVHTIIQNMEKHIPDFSMKFDWKFFSWLPFLDSLLPSDHMTIAKRGNTYRIDTTLVDFEGTSWRKGSVSFIIKFNSNNAYYRYEKNNNANDNDNNIRNEKDSVCSVYVLDNEKKEYCKVTNVEDRMSEILDEEYEEDQIDKLFRTPIFKFAKEKELKIKRKLSPGFISSKPIYSYISNNNNDDDERSEENKKPEDDQYKCSVYDIKGIALSIKKRTEHMTKEQLKKQEEFVNAFSDAKQLEIKVKEWSKTMEEELLDENENEQQEQGNENIRIINNTERKRITLPAPRPSDITPIDYFKTTTSWLGEVTAHLSHTDAHLGRPMRYSQSIKEIEGEIEMCNNFPLSVDVITSVLDILSPHHKHIQDVNEFIKHKLPGGFPVRTTLSILPTINVQATFRGYSNDRNTFPSEMFVVPPIGYEHHPTLMGDTIANVEHISGMKG